MSDHRVDAFRFTGRLIKKIILEAIESTTLAPARARTDYSFHEGTGKNLVFARSGSTSSMPDRQ